MTLSDSSADGKNVVIDEHTKVMASEDELGKATGEAVGESIYTDGVITTGNLGDVSLIREVETDSTDSTE